MRPGILPVIPPVLVAAARHAGGVAGDGAHRAVAVGVVAGPAARGQHALQRVPPAGRVEIGVVGEHHAVGAEKLQCARAGEQDVGRVVHDGAGSQDGVAGPADAGHGAGAQRGAVHDGRVHLVHAGRGEDGAVAGVEQRVVLQRHDAGGDRVQRRAAGRQDAVAGQQGGSQALVVGLGVGQAQVLGADGAGAAVQREGGRHQAATAWWDSPAWAAARIS